ncbi:outer-membrane lipoprotein carrier protein LolA [Xanthobacter autotrophicus]|uniref:outer-membrane lipoprotein carrier protein LolA n=1 Tax=Xanthobacter TaxID=279 RepID=UPI0024ABB4B7|nr:outer-membrane lipoprotein carrier protein LolA [Xanthobacter autotrophicus]MDI4666698.1 outer-membrane lipoprotein carrier protein LolA [Xanthobacter autotrophicus]
MMPSRFPAKSRVRRCLSPVARGVALSCGLAMTLAMLSGAAASAQTIQPPGDLMKPQGRNAGATAKPGPMAQVVPQAQAAANPDGRAPRATVDRITSYYNSVQALTGNFTQIDPDGTRRTGDVYMQKPGRVRFEYDPPSPVELIANGQSVAVRDRKLNTQDVTPLSQTPLRFLLAEKVDLASDPHVAGVFQDDKFISVIIQEQVPMIGTYRLLILFDAKTSALKQWIITDPQGYDTQVTLSNLQVNKKPDPKLFVINFERMLQ